MSGMVKRGQRRYVDGGPCSCGCGGIFRYSDQTRRGLSKECFVKERQRPRSDATLPCECGCRASVPQWPHKRRFFSKACSERLRARQRAALRVQTIEERLSLRLDRYPALKYIIEERREVNARGLVHLCMYCEANRTILHGGDTCSDEECRTRWNSDHSKGRRELVRSWHPKPPPKEMTCPCPCQRTFMPTSASAWNRIYYSAECMRFVLNARRRKRAERATRRLRKSHPWKAA